MIANYASADNSSVPIPDVAAMAKKTLWLALPFIVLLLGAAIPLLGEQPMTTVLSADTKAMALDPALDVCWRMGFDASQAWEKNIYRYPEIGSLRAGVYTDFLVRSLPARPNGMEYVQMIRVHQELSCGARWFGDREACPYVEPYDYLFWPSAAFIEQSAQANPGSLWLIGNEMDRVDWPGGGQDEMLPEVYAVAYHDLYHLVKDADPTAQVAIGGVIQATPLRLQYLSIVWDAYQERYREPMPVDVWNVHNFIIREIAREWGAGVPPGLPGDPQEGFVPDDDCTHIDMDIFSSQIRALRQWMKDRGQQNKPLLISEYGVLYKHPECDGQTMNSALVVQEFMRSTFDYLFNTKDCDLGYPDDECRLVQRWMWYSLDDTGEQSHLNGHGALFNPRTSQMTGTGQAYRDYCLDHLDDLAYPTATPIATHTPTPTPTPTRTPHISKVRISNLQDSGVTVSWVTDIPSTGEVRFGTTPGLGEVAYDDRGPGTNDDTHHVTLSGLTPETNHYFDIVSDSVIDDNGGAHYSANTCPALSSIPGVDTIWGQVLQQDGTTPAAGAIVYIDVQDVDRQGDQGSAGLLSALVDPGGSWSANLAEARTAACTAYFQYSASGDRVGLEAEGAADGSARRTVDTVEDSPAPDMVLSTTVSEEIPLGSGWTFLALPVEAEPAFTAEGLCQGMNAQGCDVLEIDRWHQGGWSAHICGLPFNDFDAELARGYFVRSGAGCTWTVEGLPVGEVAPLSFNPGWNSAAVPYYPAALMAVDLCQQIVTAQEICRWSGGWQCHVCGYPFQDFSIERIWGYLMRVTGSSTWPTGASGVLRLASPAVVMTSGEAPTISKVQISNVRDTSFTVSWVTDIPATGEVRFGTSRGLGQVAYDDRGSSLEDDTHHITVSGLKPETTYHLDVVSEASREDNGGAHHVVTTGPTLSLPAVDTVYGQVFQADGRAPAEGAIVYIRLRDADGRDSSGRAGLLSAQVDGSGWWYTNLAEARTEGSDGYFVYSAAGDEFSLMAEGAVDGRGGQIADTGSDTPAPATILTAMSVQTYLPLTVKTG